MLLNWLIGFFLPLMLGFKLILQERKLFFAFYPMVAAIACASDDLGFEYFWHFYPNFDESSYSSLPFNLGIFPIVTCAMLHFIYNKNIKTWLAILASTVLLTSSEWILKMLGMVTYFNGWNIGYTFLSYLLPSLAAYFYAVMFFRIFKYKD